MAPRCDANVLEIVVVSRLSGSPSMSLARNASAYWARPIWRNQPTMFKFSPLGPCRQLFFEKS
jgi:hypothetical protein